MTEEALSTSHGQHIDAPHVTKDELVTVVRQWRANALEALQADDRKASVDGYLEVTVDARLYLLSQGKL
jgi:hypothetical protein